MYKCMHACMCISAGLAASARKHLGAEERSSGGAESGASERKDTLQYTDCALDSILLKILTHAL